MSKSLYLWLAGLFYAAAIFAVSSIPGSGLPPGPFWAFDKLIHFAEFAVLCLLLILALRSSTRWSAGAVAACAFALSSVYGMSDELHQSFVPGRDASWGDILADAGGALACACAFILLSRRGRKV